MQYSPALHHAWLDICLSQILAKGKCHFNELNLGACRQNISVYLQPSVMDHHQCHICGVDKKEKLTLLYHLRRCDDGRESTCDECGLSFKGKLRLTSHKRVHQKTECVECGMEMAVGSLNHHMKTHQMKRNQVLFCDRCPYLEISEIYLFYIIYMF